MRTLESGSDNHNTATHAGRKSKRKALGNQRFVAERVQKTYRLPAPLEREFATYLRDTGQNANDVILREIADLLELWHGSSMDVKQLDYLSRYWQYAPFAAAIKEVHGRVIFGNPEFKRVVGCADVTGALPIDYFSGDVALAKRVTAQDRAALNHQRPVISVDVIPSRRERLTIRFPIFDRAHQRVEMTGVIGFDLEQIEHMARDLHPGQSGKFDTEAEAAGEDESSIPASLLRAFIYNLPAILAVKALDSRLLCLNAEYTRVTGRQRSEVLGKRPSQNWPGELGKLIETRDSEVCDSQPAIMSIDSIPRGSDFLERLNIRFRILEHSGDLNSIECIGLIGLDYRVIKRAINLLCDPSRPSAAYAFLLSSDPDSLKPIPLSV